MVDSCYRYSVSDRREGDLKANRLVEAPLVAGAGFACSGGIRHAKCCSGTIGGLDAVASNCGRP